MFNADFFHEHQKALLGFLNSNIGGAVRRSLWIPEYKNLVVKLSPNAAHVILPNGSVKAVLYSNKQYSQALHRNYKPLWEALHWWDMKLANKFLPAWNAGFDTYSSQPNDTAGLDNYIVQVLPTTNLGTNATLSVGESNTGSNDTRRILIKFDFSSITPPVTTSSVVFSLWQFTRESSNARDFKIYRQKRDWSETQSTWNIWKTSNNWSAAGGFHADDCEQTSIASLNLSATEAAGQKQWTGWTTSSVDEMINGSWTNNGFMIKADTELNDAQFFRSSDYATAGERPKLEITYLPSSGGNFFPYF